MAAEAANVMMVGILAEKIFNAINPSKTAPSTDELIKEGMQRMLAKLNNEVYKESKQDSLFNGFDNITELHDETEQTIREFKPRTQDDFIIFFINLVTNYQANLETSKFLGKAPWPATAQDIEEDIKAQNPPIKDAGGYRFPDWRAVGRPIPTNNGDSGNEGQEGGKPKSKSKRKKHQSSKKSSTKKSGKKKTHHKKSKSKKNKKNKK